MKVSPRGPNDVWNANRRNVAYYVLLAVVTFEGHRMNRVAGKAGWLANALDCTASDKGSTPARHRVQDRFSFLQSTLVQTCHCLSSLHVGSMH